ncbi:MAG: LLM class flavin-dependent oxidoreductase [bacterium]|nr:LLM class flavin-dependent oxidoreductase [bacterium]
MEFWQSIVMTGIDHLIEVAKIAEEVGFAGVTVADHLVTPNRVLIGIGIGWMEEEFELVGRPFQERGRRTEELMQVARKLFSGERVEHHGEFYDFDPVQLAPVPKNHPPVLIGGHSPKALRRAAAADGWLGVNYDLEKVPPILAALREDRCELGREHAPFHVALALNDLSELEELHRLEEAGLSMIINPPAMSTSGEQTSLDEKREQLESYAKRFIVH